MAAKSDFSFIDPQLLEDIQTFATVAISLLSVIAGFLILFLILWGIDRISSRRRER